MRSRFKDLVAYQRAVAVADAVHRLVMDWPDIDRRTSGVQLLRAADSIGANIAEASGRWTKAERRRFLLTARASLYEPSTGWTAPECADYQSPTQTTSRSPRKH